MKALQSTISIITMAAMTVEWEQSRCKVEGEERMDEEFDFYLGFGLK